MIMLDVSYCLNDASPGQRQLDVITLPYKANNSVEWDVFVDNQLHSCLYHLSSWHKIIKSSYGHDIYCLVAKSDALNTWESSSIIEKGKIENNQYRNHHNNIVGILPLVHIKHWLFGNNLVSMPYSDLGGILAENRLVEQALLNQSAKLAENLGASSIYLRSDRPFFSVVAEENDKNSIQNRSDLFNWKEWNLSLQTKKVRMILSLPESPEILRKSFKSKLRSQIQKPIKEGLKVKIGGIELINDFYDIFSTNMHGLGSPVHSKKLIREVLREFPKMANLFIVYGDQTPMACSLVIGFKDILANPWASSLRRYSRFAPNMLLYWAMLEYACQQGYKRFDFGRCTPGEGSYKFKEQWGAVSESLYWYQFSKNESKSFLGQPEEDKMAKVIEYWKKLPLPLTKIIGPQIRKYIHL